MHHTRTFLFAAEVVHGQRAVYFLFILSHIHKTLSSFVTLPRHNHSIHQFQQLFLPLLCKFAVPIPLAYRNIGAMASHAIFNSLRVLRQERFLPSRVTAKTFHGQSRIVLLGTKKKQVVPTLRRKVPELQIPRVLRLQWSVHRGDTITPLSKHRF